MKSLLTPLLLLAALSLGCAPPAKLQTPEGFAILEGQTEYVYRATSADGVVLAIRSEQNKPRGNLDFWADVLDRQVRRNGYVASDKTADVRSSQGVPGKRLRYEREQEGRKYRYWITVYVTDDKVWCVEAGGDEERFTDKVQVVVQKAIDSLTIG